MDFGTLAQIVGIPTAMAIVGILAFLRGWVVPGWLYREVRAENRELRRLAYGTARAGERTARVAERAVGVIARQKDDAGDSDARSD